MTWEGTDFFGNRLVAVRGSDGTAILSVCGEPKVGEDDELDVDVDPPTISLSRESCASLAAWLTDEVKP